jgi:hypothetical protein
MDRTPVAVDRQVCVDLGCAAYARARAHTHFFF